MIYYCMALYREAAPLIRRLNLKKCAEETHFQMFENDGYSLILTGVGELRAVAAVTYLLTKRPPTASDLLVNVGICGSSGHARGSCWICNKMIQACSGRTFYPDILLRHPFREASVTTVEKVADCGTEDLADMEATGVYQAGQIFLQPHQMAFVKVVSDAADGTCVTGEQVEMLIGRHANRIIDWSGRVREILIHEAARDFTTAEEEKLLSETAEHGLSVTQTRKLRQFMRWYKLTGGDMMKLLSEMPPRTQRGKEEGRNYLEQLEKRIL